MVSCSEYIRKRFVSSRLNVLARVDARVIGLYDVLRLDLCWILIWLLGLYMND